MTCSIGTLQEGRWQRGEVATRRENVPALCSGPLSPLYPPSVEQKARERYPLGAAHRSWGWEPIGPGATIYVGVEVLSLPALLDRLAIGGPCPDCDGAGHNCTGLPGDGPDYCPICGGTGKEWTCCEGHRVLLEPPCERCEGFGEVASGRKKWDHSAPGFRPILMQCPECEGRRFGPPRIDLAALMVVPCPSCRREGYVLERSQAGPSREACEECETRGTVPHPDYTAALESAREFGLLEGVEA